MQQLNVFTCSSCKREVESYNTGTEVCDACKQAKKFEGRGCVIIEAAPNIHANGCPSDVFKKGGGVNHL